MLFRVTYSSNVNEYYCENPKDTQFAITVEAKSFKDAENEADAECLGWLVFPNRFEVVSIQKMDQDEDTILKCDCVLCNE